MKLKSLTLALIAGGVFAAGTANALDWNPSELFQKTQSTSTAPSPVAPTAAQGNAAPIGVAITPNYRAIVEQAGPAVVGITTEGTVKTAATEIPEQYRNHPFFEFFQGMPRDGERGGPPNMPRRGQGSGFIVEKDGLILTNAHVVEDASEVTVKLSDRREFKAKVLGTDPATDVAVLKIDASDLPAVNIGQPSRLGVGDHVLAIGSPFGFEQSATAGIVSAKGRSLPGDGLVPFIQTDVAVNPGNSGGPLFDAQGTVVGINSQIYSRTGGYQGVSFAIPIDVALKVKDQIVKTGKVSHARLGVTVQELNQSLAESFKLKQPEGALVSNVAPGSAAAKAGLAPGDIILKYNDQPVTRSGDLTSRVGLATPGDKVAIEVWRDGKKQQLDATLMAAEEATADSPTAASTATQPKLGVAVRPLTAEEKQGAHLPGGVLVQQASGPAARSGVRAGDIIVSVNGRPVADVDDLKKAVSAKEKNLALLIQRGDEKIFVPVNVG
jgi:serine protease Do